VPAAGPPPRGCILHLAIELEQDRLHRAHHERQRHEQESDQDSPALETHVHTDRRLRPVEGKQRQARNDRREGERELDERVDDALTREAVADEGPRDRRPGNGVHERDDERDPERQLQR